MRMLKPRGQVRLSLLLIGVIAPTALLAALCFAQDGTKPANPAVVTAGKSKKFKNIKVLKDLPEDKLIMVMHSWNDSLGVGCDFCHVVDANHKGWEKDDKKMKLVARDMVLMSMAANKHKTTHGKVTCYTCHRGKPEPEEPARK